MESPTKSQTQSSTTIVDNVDQNIEAIHSHRKNSDEKRRLDQKLVDHVAGFLGTINSIYIHMIVYIIFATFRSAEQVGILASIEAIALAVFVLINQRRLSALERKNSDLHLQTSLLTEQEITRLARVTDLIAVKLGIDLVVRDELKDVKKDILPTEVLKRITAHQESWPTHSTSDSFDK